MEYLDSCSTALRCVVRKVSFNYWQGIYCGDMFSGQMDLLYDIGVE